MLILPLSTGITPLTARTSVDFPAPLGPINATTSPELTSSETSCRTRFLPYETDKFSNAATCTYSLLFKLEFHQYP